MISTNHQDKTVDIIEDDDDESVAIYEDNTDDEYDPEEDPFILDSDTFERLKRNDPSMIDLRVDLDCDDDAKYVTYFFNKIDWKADGDCIANNTHLKRMRIHYNGKYLGGSNDLPRYVLGEEGDDLPTRQQLQDFFSCIHQNSSIKSIMMHGIGINDEFGAALIEGLSVHPSLMRINLQFDELGSLGCQAFGKVLKHPKSKLKDLNLSHCKLNNEGIQKLCHEQLLGNSTSTLKRLNLKCNKEIDTVGWQALSNVIQHPNSKLTTLAISDSNLIDTGAKLLGSALSGSSVKALNLSYNFSIFSDVWPTVLNQLSQAPIEYLSLNNNNVNDASLETLASIGTLKSLGIGRNNWITPSGWQSFFSSLQSRGTKLVRLDIGSNGISDESTVALGSLISNTPTLKILNMSNMRRQSHVINSRIPSNRITPQGWLALLTSLQDSNLDLEELYIGSNSIDNEGMQLLIRMISSMTSLKRLNLSQNGEPVDSVVWQSLSEVFQSPNCTLEHIDMCYNINVDNDVVVAYANALTHNNTLKWFDLSECNFIQASENNVPEVVSTLLCNKSSIMDTYNSNHTLHRFCENLPDEQESYLELNRNEDKVEVARQKILQIHFSDDATTNIQEFLDMDLKLIPTVIERLGKPLPIGWRGTNVSGLSTMYNLMRRLPDLFDSGAAQKKSMKRKRS